MAACQSATPSIVVFPRLGWLLAEFAGAVLQSTTPWLHRIVCLSGVEEPTITEEPSDGPRNGIVVIDVSDSMRSIDWKPSRLEAAKKAAKVYVEELGKNTPGAMVGVVAYGSRAATLCPLTSVHDYGAIARAIDAARPRGATNITDGLKVAATMLAPDQRRTQIVLLSDGHHNTGPGPERIAADIRQRATVECTGIGGKPTDVDEPLLKRIASHYPDGSKRYKWIGDSDALQYRYKKLAGRITRQ